MSENFISIFSNSDIELDHRPLLINSKLPLDICYPRKFRVNQMNQTQVVGGEPKADSAYLVARPPTSA